VADDLLSAATDALRETPIEGDGAATRLRVRRSLEASHRGRRQLAGFLTGTGILLAGTMSWAFATGRASAVWHAIVDPAPVHVERAAPEPAAAPGRAGAVRVAPPVQPTPVEPEPAAVEPAAVEPAAVEPEPAAVEPAAVEPAAPPRHAAAPRGEVPAVRAGAPSIRAEAAPPPLEELYRRAHELHFHGSDYPAAIAAWEAYLAAEPTGRFVAEARYNRALLLIRVGRYAEARAALAPYARGEIAGGYRRAEAAQLVERLPEGAPDRGAGRDADRDVGRDR
jgi:tetratricopeptide (TPR) repeat protein